MYYHFDRVKSLALLGLALLSLFTLRQYNSRNMIFGNLKQDVKEPLLKAIEQVHLTNQQKKIYLHENWFLKPSVLPYNLSEKLKSKKFFSQDKQKMSLWTIILKICGMEFFLKLELLTG